MVTCGMSDHRFRINRIILLSLVLVFLAIFAYSLAGFYTSSPSPELSRELILDTVDGVRFGSMDRPVAMVRLSDSSSDETRAVGILINRGDSLHYLESDAEGDILRSVDLETNPGDSPHIAARRAANGHLIVFLGRRVLERLEYDSRFRLLSRDIVTRDLRSFEGSGSRLAILRSDGLYLRSDLSGSLVGPVAPGSVERFVSTESGDSTTVGYVSTQEDGGFRLGVFTFDDTLAMTGQRVLLESSRDDYLRKIAAIRRDPDGYTVLSAFRDNREGRNIITLQHFGENTLIQGDRTQLRVPIVGSRYHLLEPESDMPGEPDRFIMRSSTIYGYNLVECRLGSDGEPEFRDLTKTRNLSTLAGRVALGPYALLVVCDLTDGGMRVLAVSNHPEAVRSTTRWYRTDWGTILGTTATHFILAFFSCWIFLLIAAPGGLIVVGVAQRLFSGTISHYRLFVAVGALLYTAVKLLVTRHFIASGTERFFLIPWVGTGWGLYAALVLMSLVSYGILASDFRRMREQQHSIVEAYLRYVIFDAVIYSAMFLIYGITSMLLAKM